MLYSLPPVKNMNEFKALLFENLRINEFLFDQLNFDDILFLSEKYKSTNIKYLVKLIEREYQKTNTKSNV